MFLIQKAGKEPGHLRRLTIHLIHNIDLIQIANSRPMSSQAHTAYLQEIALSAKKSNTRLVTVFLSVSGGSPATLLFTLTKSDPLYVPPLSHSIPSHGRW